MFWMAKPEEPKKSDIGSTLIKILLVLGSLAAIGTAAYLLIKKYKENMCTCCDCCDDECDCCDCCGDDDEDEDEEFYCAMCPNCGGKVYFDDTVNPEDVICPACQKPLLEEEEDEGEDL